jgi:hypothetical protein
MSEELPTVTPATPDASPDEPETVWPAVPAVPGVVYGFMDPNHGGDIPMVAMTFPTWQRFAKQLETMKTRLATLSQENIEMKQGRHPDGPRIFLPGG